MVAPAPPPRTKLPLEAPLLRGLSADDLSYLADLTEHQTVAEGQAVLQEGDVSDALYLVLEGAVQVFRGDLALSVLRRGALFGEIGALGGQKRSGTVRAMEPTTLVRISVQAIGAIRQGRPALLEAIQRNIIRSLGRDLVEMTDDLGRLLQERARPLRSEVEIQLPTGPVQVGAATPLWRLLPKEVDGRAVIAAKVNQKTVSLATPLYAPGRVEPVLMGTWEGRAVHRRSVGLLLLEAARRVAPNLRPHIGSSLGFAHIVELGIKPEPGLVARLRAEMDKLVCDGRVLRRERSTVEEARERLLAQGWRRAARLLRIWRDGMVTLAGYGEVFAIEFSPFAHTTHGLGGFGLAIQGEDLLLYFGGEKVRSDQLVMASHPGRLARMHARWLKQLEIDSVGAFNDMCIEGRVGDIIRVSEGFHEKRISQIADAISNAGRRVRAICIAGPSSSGKSTFIKRLTVQLQVNGLRPHSVGLDDYYVDRERTVRDEHGEYDFEAFEAIDVKMLADDLGRLMKGEEVRTATYDFVTGESKPGSQPPLRLGPDDVLLIEGIHALNPQLPVCDEDGVFRIFINPMTSLPLDDVNRVSVSDVRLLRRIVRDRQKRAITAAENIRRWPAVRRGELKHIYPHQSRADAVFNSSLLYEVAVLRVYAERYLLEVPEDHPSFSTAFSLRRLIDKFVAIYPDHVPMTSLLREFIG